MVLSRGELDFRDVREPQFGPGTPPPRLISEWAWGGRDGGRNSNGAGKHDDGTNAKGSQALGQLTIVELELGLLSFSNATILVRFLAPFFVP